MKEFIERHPIAMGTLLVALIVNASVINSGLVPLGDEISGDLIASLANLLCIAAIFGLLALLITQAKKNRPPINVKRSAGGKWRFALRRTVPVVPVILIVLFGNLLFNGRDLSFYVIRNYIVVVIVLAVGIFVVSAAVWKDQEAEYMTEKHDSGSSDQHSNS